MSLLRMVRVCLHWRVPATLVLAVIASAPAAAQSSRAEEIAQQQEAKAESPGATRRNRVERALLDIESGGGFGIQRGFFVTFGDIKAGSGIALGPVYGRTFANGSVVQAKAAYSIRNFKVAQLFVQAPPMAQGRLIVNGRARWQDAPTLAVYELGTQSPRTRADYAETRTEISGQAFFRPIRLLRFGAGTGFERFDTGPSSGRVRPSVEALFTPQDLPGLGGDPDYLHTHVSAALDSRPGVSFSRSGSYLGATLHDYRERTSGSLSFQRTDATARQIIPILHGNWVIDLALRASVTSADPGEAVPFFLMPSLGGGSALRGYENYRFRDRHSLLFTAEYRWYAQEFLEMALFYDAGKVTARRADLDFDGLKSDFGIGLRLHGPQTTLVRAEVAKGREGLRFILSFNPSIP